nr:sulfite exporter TauE/SafE family protein [Roseovarius halotolerans]
MVSELGLAGWGVLLTVGLGAGIVKGVVGFAMPMVMISALGSMVSPEVALAGLIIPTVVTNVWQALRQGIGAAWESTRRFWRFLLVGFVLLMGSAQLVPYLPKSLMSLMIGVPVAVYAAWGLSGRPLALPGASGRRGEAIMGAVAGFFAGFSGVWGPPTVAMLTARGTDMQEQMRVQGVIYGLGSVALAGAHLVSGVLNSATAPLSMALVLPALAGLWLGFRIQDRIDQRTFRKLTLLVLLIAGLNLIRRGVLAI